MLDVEPSVIATGGNDEDEMTLEERKEKDKEIRRAVSKK